MDRVEPPFGLCVRCGWSGYNPRALVLHSVDYGQGPTTEGITFSCPSCHGGNVVRVTPRARVDVDLATALRGVSMTSAQWSDLQAVLASGPAVSPDELATQFPDARPIINYTVNNYGTDLWVTILGIIVTAIVGIGVGYWQIHADQPASGARPKTERPLHLSDKDVRKVAAEVERGLAHRRDHGGQADQDPGKHEPAADRDEKPDGVPGGKPPE